jgi:glycosyltransferase involved in cell wall biosynthesis
MKLSVVIPAYNEELNIGETIRELKENLCGIGYIDSYDINVVDDHSSDETFKVIQSLNEENINCTRLSRRSGSHAAIRAGLAYSDADAVLCISADGQDDSSCVNKMIEKLQQGAKIVWALRKNRQNEPWYIRMPAQLFYRLLFWLGDSQTGDIELSRADFFLLDRDIVNAVNSCSERNTSLFGLIVWLGFKQDSVEYERGERRLGKSKWNFRSRFHLLKDWIVAFSGIPLKFMSVLGIFTAIMGFIYGIYIVINTIFGTPTPGWSSIMVAIFVLGGIQMFMLGIIGEYLWRDLDESRRRPLYFVEMTTFIPQKNTIKSK